MYKGIDVSDNQGKIDWKKVKAAGCDFAILRSVRRSGKADNQFLSNVFGCQGNGIPFEVYKYTYAETPSQAVTEAMQVIDLLQSYNLACRVWWDVEDLSLQNLGSGVLTGLIQTARNTIEGAGLGFGIYTGKAFYEAGYFNTMTFECPFWIARYPISSNFSFAANPPADKWRPVIPQPLMAWQYTSKGRINGIDGVVDLNACYIPFWEDADQSAPSTSIAEPDGSPWANIAGLSYTPDAAHSIGQALEQPGMNTLLRRTRILEYLK